jgi:glycosyltransferase involved in cell wall biosynthesis
MGIAVAPVTNWKYYDNIYTERFMRTPKENINGYEDNSPITHAGKLKGKYMLIHGTADDNVHFQNAMEFTNALIKENIQFDQFSYPNKKNNLIFCGSFDYLPNEEGLIWFVENCWGDLKKIFPSIKLIVIGSGCKSNTLKLSLLKEGIEDIGYVKDVSEFYKSAKIAVVPINKGSGTRLKILEAMSFALPVVSTSKGAEGIDYTNDENILISDNHIGFVKCIEHLILKEEMQSYIGMNALNLIKQKYDWNIVGKKIKNQLV